jgi:hypothetical protein
MLHMQLHGLATTGRKCLSIRAHTHCPFYASRVRPQSTRRMCVYVRIYLCMYSLLNS